MNAFENVAVILPCLNEEIAIGAVVEDLRRVLPGAIVYVYDNGSTDSTREIAATAGAVVRSETRRGKGNAIRRAFADVDADVYVMLDGDGTYDAASAPKMVDLLRSQNLDLVTGVREDHADGSNLYRRGHRLGNRAFTAALRVVFGSGCQDVLSGYRVMSRRFVKSFPMEARGFELEVELTAHASLLRVPTADVETDYRDRPPQSESQLRTYRDGFRIMRAVFRIFRAYSPSRFFGSLSLFSAFSSAAILLSSGGDGDSGVTATTLTGSVFGLLAVLLLSVGIILNAVSRHRLETLRLAYLAR